MDSICFNILHRREEKRMEEIEELYKPANGVIYIEKTPILGRFQKVEVMLIHRSNKRKGD